MRKPQQTVSKHLAPGKPLAANANATSLQQQQQPPLVETVLYAVALFFLVTAAVVPSAYAFHCTVLCLLFFGAGRSVRS